MAALRVPLSPCEEEDEEDKKEEEEELVVRAAAFADAFGCGTTPIDASMRRLLRPSDGDEDKDEDNGGGKLLSVAAVAADAVEDKPRWTDSK